MAHPWESWSDARAYDGTATILQPQALPLYGGVSAHEILGALYGTDHGRAEQQSVKATWKDQLGRQFRERLVRRAGQRRVAWHGERQVRSSAFARAARNTALPPAESGALSVLFRPDPSLWDGRFANNPWLQELPRPLTKLVWDNPLLIAPALGQADAARERRPRAAVDRRGERRRAGLDHAGTGARLHHGAARLRPPRGRGRSAMAPGSTSIR